MPRRPAVLLTTCAALASPAAASAANGPLVVNENGRTGSSAVVELRWHNGPGWEQTRGAMEGTPAVGHYHRAIDLGDGATCKLQLSGTGFAVAEGDRPKFRKGILAVRRPKNWGLERFAVAERSGTTKPKYLGRWRTTTDGPTLTGIAVRRTPSYFRTRARALTLLRFDLRSTTERWRQVPQGQQPLEPTDEQERRCAARTRSEAPAIVRGALTTSRVQRKR